MRKLFRNIALSYGMKVFQYLEQSTVWVKKVAPLKLFAVFLSWWTCVIENYLGYCPNIFLCLHQFCFIYLNICVKCIIFTGVTPQILRIQFSLLRNSLIFRKNASHIKWHLIKYNNQYLLYELSHYMFKISTAGWHTCLQSTAVAFHTVVNGFLWQGRPNQLKCICKLVNCFSFGCSL